MVVVRTLAKANQAMYKGLWVVFFMYGIVIFLIIQVGIEEAAAAVTPGQNNNNHNPHGDYYGAVPESLASALDSVFALQSQSGNAGDLFLCRKRTMDLMRRQRIPIHADAMRRLSDEQLNRIGILAAVAGLGQWKRDEATDKMLIDDHGMLVRAFVPSMVESDVLLCLICALMSVIAVRHAMNVEEIGTATT